MPWWLNILAACAAIPGVIAVYCFFTSADEAMKSLKIRRSGVMTGTTLHMDRAHALFLYGSIAGILFVIFFVAFFYVSLTGDTYG